MDKIDEIMKMIRRYALQIGHVKEFEMFLLQNYGPLYGPNEQEEKEYEEEVVIANEQFNNIREAIIDLTWSVKE